MGLPSFLSAGISRFRWRKSVFEASSLSDAAFDTLHLALLRASRGLCTLHQPRCRYHSIHHLFVEMAPRRRRPPRAGALTELPPLKILMQIILLQVIFYVCATVLIIFTALVAGEKFGLDMVLDWRSIRGDNTVGWTLGLVWLLNSLIGCVSLDTVHTSLLTLNHSVLSLLLIVARSKLILDFALTIHFLHLLVTSFYAHAFPTNRLWWVLQATSAALMTSLGIWSCQWRELQPINFGGSKTAAASTSENTSDLEEGLSNGRTRGRARDSAGDYELVGMRAKDGLTD